MELYSVKMRGAKNDKHISGAENIIAKENLDKVVSALISRALEHSKGSADFINLKLEKVEDYDYINPLESTTINVTNVTEGFLGLKKVLSDIGLSNNVIEEAVKILNEIRDMRGAVILDIHTLERLEKSKDRGVRVTYMDLENRDETGLTKSQKYNTHFIEALVLATKVMAVPSIVAELCYSDDANYTAGYVATKQFGYVRFDYLKEKGQTSGGRVFLFDSSKGKLEEAIEYLENRRVIVKDEIKINDSVDLNTLLEVGING